MPRPNKSPLAYLGVEAPNPPNVIVANTNPGSDDKYDLGTIWVNENTNNIYILASITSGSPYWVSIGSDTMTDYIVDDSDPTAYSTIQSAITAAHASGIPSVIYVRPGTDGVYTEDLTLYDNIMIQGAGLETTITGVHTPPASGTVTMYDLTLTSATDIFTSAAAGTTHIVLFNCIINCTNGYTFDLSNWTGTLQLLQCAESSAANGVVNNAGGATVTLWNSVCGAGTTQDFTLTDGSLTMFGSRLVCQSTIDGSTTFSITMGSSIGGTFTTSDTASGSISETIFSTGSTSAISHGSSGTFSLSNSSITSTNATVIDGAGTGKISLTGVEFTSGHAISTSLVLGRGGLSYSSSDIQGRSINVTNTNITSFNSDPILQTNATTGGAPTGATGDYNIMYLQDGITMKQFILGAGQTIIAPRLADDGLLISLDLTTSEGAEYYFGHTSVSKHSFTIGTSPAFFVEATFKVADCGVSDPLWLGFRKRSAPDADFTNYTDAAVIGLRATTNADTVIIGDNLNAGGWTYTNTTDAWADGETHTIRVDVSASGVVTYLIDGADPTVTHAITFDSTDVVIPFIHHLFAAAGTPAAIHLQSFKCGYQD